MKLTGKATLAISVVASVVLAGVLLGLLGGRSGPAPSTGKTSLSSADASGGGFPGSGDGSGSVAERPVPIPATATVAPAPVEPPRAAWEDRIDRILQTDESEAAKAAKMLEIFPSLPPSGQEEAAQHLSNLVDDKDYAPLGKLLQDPKLPEGVLDVLVVDLLNRPNSTKLPLLLEVAQNSDHPKAGEAKELMQLYLESDFGTDWGQWKARMERWLKDNPD